MSRSSTANPIPNVAQRAVRTLEIGLTTVIAWAFGMATAGVLLYVASGLWRGDFQVATPLSAADPTIVSAGALHAAKPWALTFNGPSGAAIAAGMAAGVMIALGLSMMLSGSPRRLGLLMLTVWAGLWAADGAMLVGSTWNGSGFSAAVPVITGAAAIVLVFGCMIHRMLLLWRVRVVM